MRGLRTKHPDPRHIPTGLYLTPITKDGTRLRCIEAQHLTFWEGRLVYRETWEDMPVCEVLHIEVVIIDAKSGHTFRQLVNGRASLTRAGGSYTAQGDIGLGNSQNEGMDWDDPPARIEDGAPLQITAGMT